MSEPQRLTVFYDGACPLCRREIAFYRGRRGAETVTWCDVSTVDAPEVTDGLSRDAALARFHVRDASGRLMSGGAAFARLWEEMPAFRSLGRAFRHPPLRWLIDRSYDLFLHLRPGLQWLARRAEDDRAEDDRAEDGRSRIAGSETDGAVRPKWLVRDLRSDHAGETGAVAIYRGILTVTRNEEIRRFAEAHLETERRHLADIEAVLPPRDRSRCLPLWRVAGFLTGALPALFGPRAVYATIAAVETFVDRHYAEQIERLDPEGAHAALRALLETCRLDEVHHRDEAREALDAEPGALMTLWCRTVGSGSALAVALARRV
ncbi:demethoxyubiquinone hydroxylase family protein [Pelagibius sp.]|uniref:demethoxyubiquinone hydroxylase family protein n=1 Tax=Pelagibius sp. TaxID=1931238 RepID=UPI003B50265C